MQDPHAANTPHAHNEEHDDVGGDAVDLDASRHIDAPGGES